MPSRSKKIAREVAKLPSIPKELVSLFLTGPMTGEAINAAGLALKKALVEASLNAELSHHLGYEAGADRPELVTNQRNGSTAKSVLTGDGTIRIDTPRDRDGSFEPVLVPKHARRFTGFDDKVTALYARGLTVREIQAFLLETYDTEVSPDFISTVTDGVLAEVTAWQSRPLEAVYAVVFFDALRVKIREDAVVRNKAIYLALGVRRDGSREILGLWIETTEGAKFWMKVFNDLRTRGVTDMLIAVTDGLKGMPEALGTVFPATTLQTCIVHLIRNSLDYATWKDRKALAAALRPIYAAPSAEAALAALDAVQKDVEHGHCSLAHGDDEDALIVVQVDSFGAAAVRKQTVEHIAFHVNAAVEGGFDVAPGKRAVEDLRRRGVQVFERQIGDWHHESCSFSHPANAFCMGASWPVKK